VGGRGFTLTLDLGASNIHEIALSTLSDFRIGFSTQQRRLLHLGCRLRELGGDPVEGDHRGEAFIRLSRGRAAAAGPRASTACATFVSGSKGPSAARVHSSAGGRSWVFIDEIVVR